MQSHAILTLSLLSGLLPAQTELLRKLSSVPAEVRTWNAQQVANSPAIEASEFALLDTKALMRMRAPLQTFRLDLFGEALDLEISSVQQVHNYRVFEGRVVGRQGDTCIVVAPDHRTAYATIHLVDESYVLYTAPRSKVHVVRKLRANHRTVRSALSAPTSGGLQPDPSSSSHPTGGNTTVLDVALFYTQRARQAAGGRTGIEAELIGAMAKLNRTCRNSNSTVGFRLTLMEEVQYTETTPAAAIIPFINKVDGEMDAVHDRRNDVGADLMGLVIESATNATFAFRMLHNDRTSERWAFSVNSRVALPTNGLAWGVGVNLGCGGSTWTGIFSDSKAFINTNGTGTTMSNATLPRADVWSGPTVQWNGATMGNAMSNNVSTLDRTRAAAASFRPARDIDHDRIGGEVAGGKGVPSLDVVGILTSNTLVPTLTLGNYPNGAPGILAVGTRPANVPWLGGTLIPSPEFVIPIQGRVTGADLEFDASLLATATWNELWIQCFWLDRTAAQGAAASPGYRMGLR